jgi:uncharacterized protein
MLSPLVLVMWLVSATPAYSSVGLDCTKAKSKVEGLICDGKANPYLWGMDYKMNKFYNHYLRESGSKQDVTKAQRKWLREVRNVCEDAPCVEKAYRSRIAELQQVSTLCNLQEYIVFSCTLTQRKIVSLCTSKDAKQDVGYMQYRMGENVSAVEMEFPQHKELAKSSFKYRSAAMDTTRAVSFWSGENRFSVFDTTARYAIYNAAGLIESHGHPPVRVSYSKCINEPLVFHEYDDYSSITILNLDKTLGLTDAGNDFSYVGVETDEPKPGEFEDWKLRSKH